MISNMKMIKLNEEVSLPVLGFGCWQLEPNGETQKSVEAALEVGYRHIDTADAYGNHRDVAKAIQNSGIERKQLFITTKIWRDDLSKKGVLDSAERFMEELKTDYFDLLLIHWPNREYPIDETLAAMNELKEKGIIKAIGVSNFTQHHLEDALKTGVEVTNNQIELHPTFNNQELVRFCKENGMTVTSYSTNGRRQDLELDVIKELAKKYEKTPYQIILNWAISQDILVIPRSSKPERVKENFGAIDFELSLEDIALINQVSQEPRLSAPGFADFDY